MTRSPRRFQKKDSSVPKDWHFGMITATPTEEWLECTDGIGMRLRTPCAFERIRIP